jgi:hypothetical protein
MGSIKRVKPDAPCGVLAQEMKTTYDTQIAIRDLEAKISI